jgi:hypothetical protein
MMRYPPAKLVLTASYPAVAMPRLIVLLASALVAPPFLGQGIPPIQSLAPAQPGLIVGRVVDAGSGAGIAGAAVTAAAAAGPGQPAGPPRQRPSILTDGDGRFVLTVSPAGRVNLSAGARGYLMQPYGALRPGGTGQPLDLAAGEKLSNIVIRMWKGATISGRILDEAGEPVDGVSVGIMKRELASGRVRYVTAGAAGSDDRGRYASSPLAPGNYIVVIAATRSTMPASIMDMAEDALAGSNADRAAFERKILASNLPPIIGEPGYRIGDLFLVPAAGIAALISTPDAKGRFDVVDANFFPAATSPTDATVLTMSAGEARDGIDLRLRMAPAASVSGVVTRPDGSPVGYLDVRLALASLGHLATFTAFETAVTLTDAQGRFTLLGVPRGSYLLRSRLIAAPETAGGEAGSVMEAVVPIAVGDSDLRDVIVALNEAPRLSGRVEFEGSSPPASAQLARLAIEVQSVDSRFPGAPPVPRGVVAADGQFRTTGIAAGSYVLRAAGVPGWTVKTAMIAGKDVSDEPFSPVSDVTGVVVTLTNSPGGVSGVVSRADGRPDPDAAVLAFPADPARVGVRRRQFVRVDQKGAYSINGLPAGDYILIAIDDRLATDWEELTLLRDVARLGTRLTVPASGIVALDLRTSDFRRERP